MKQYPVIGLLASGIFVLTVVNAVQAQGSTSENQPAVVQPPRNEIACFSQIKNRVLAENPHLKSQSAVLRSLRAQSQQAALLPNPVLSFESENLAANSSDIETEYTGGISQLIETGGKRQARTSLAKAIANSFAIRRDITKLEILEKARTGYAEVIAAKTRLALSEREVEIRRQFQRLISKKSSHGGALRLEVDKADVSLQTAKIVLERRKQELRVAKRNLGSLWGTKQLHLTFTEDELMLIDPEAELASAASRETPDTMLAKAEREAAEKATEVQRAMVVPNVTVSAGYRRFDSTDDHAFVANVSVPLPLFNRNQFGVDQVKEQLSASEFDISNTQIAVEVELENLRDQLRLLLRERRLLQQKVLPQTEQVLRSATNAYRIGRISFLDYFDSQTSFLEHRERLVAVTLSAIRNQVKIQRLNGTLVEKLNQLDKGECDER